MNASPDERWGHIEKFIKLPWLTISPGIEWWRSSMRRPYSSIHTWSCRVERFLKFTCSRVFVMLTLLSSPRSTARHKLFLENFTGGLLLLGVSQHCAVSAPPRPFIFIFTEKHWRWLLDWCQCVWVGRVLLHSCTVNYGCSFMSEVM